MTRRSRMDLIVDILTEALSGANKTRIMYRANLNFVRFNAYLTEMLRSGLLVREKNGNGQVVYRTSAAGVTLLETLAKAKDLIAV
jgi:predicted transcriptional regulator